MGIVHAAASPRIPSDPATGIPARPTLHRSPAASSATRERPARERTTQARAARDTGIDLARALCVVAIVLLHALQLSVTVGVSGPVLEYATDGAAWYPPVTWALQVLPLFFVIGGFSGALAHRRGRAKGGSDVGFVACRVHRLLVPAVFTIATVGVALAMLRSLGVPAELLADAGTRHGETFWFLGVFLGAQALLPMLLAAHERAPVGTLVGLVAAAVLVDAVRGVTGMDAIGYLNVVLVWLALQQLGFFLADGHIDALRGRTRLLIASGALALLIGSVATGVHSPDLIAAMNPPTTALLLLGAFQTMALSLLRDPLRRLSSHPHVARFVDFVTARAMTIYLWHMPVLLTMSGAGALLAIGGMLPLPTPSSGGWWLGRPLWFAVAIGASAVVATLLSRLERGRPIAPTRSPRRAAQAVLLGLAAVLLIVTGTTVPRAAAATVLMLVALSRIRAPQHGPATPVGLSRCSSDPRPHR